MFDDGQAELLDGRYLDPPTTRCESCGAQNPAGYHYCYDCGARAEGTLAYGAVVHLTLASAWFGRARTITTAVSTPTPRDEVDACATTLELKPANDNVVAAGVDTERRAMDEAWVEMIDRMTCSPAELAWESLEGADITAVWNEAPGTVVEPVPPTLRTEIAATPRAAMLIQLAPDGYPGQGTPMAAAFVARGSAIDIGRACEGFGHDDPYLEEWHARLSSHAEGLQVHDPGTRGGVWMRLRGPRWLRDGDRFRVGQQFLVFDAVGGANDCGRRNNGERGRIQLVHDGERSGLAVSICGPTTIGRAGTEVVLGDDPFVSVAHCRLVAEGDGVQLEDLGSSNGTWVRLSCGDVIPFGAIAAIGQSVYRVEPVDR